MIVDYFGDGARMFEICPTCLSLVHHGSVQRNNDMEGKRVLGVVINGRITMDCLGFTYALVFTV